MKKAEKTFFVQNLTEEIKAAKSLILVDFSGMGVKIQQELKKRLKQAGAKMLVVKNTLFKLAGKEAKLDSQTMADEILTGQNALIISEEDPITPLQILGKFMTEFDLPELKVGIVEGSFQDKEGLIKLSQLPSKEVLLSQVVAAVGAPIFGLKGILEANLQKLIFVLKQASKGGDH